jgi:hypothetical protein
LKSAILFALLLMPTQQFVSRETNSQSESVKPQDDQVAIRLIRKRGCSGGRCG